MADNFFFDLHCTPMLPSLEIAFSNAPGKKATHYKKDTEKNRLILAWHESPGYSELLAPVTAETAEPMVKEWLKEQAVYGSQPDHDGDNGRSWRIYCESWGHVEHNHYAFVAIEPLWAEYGK